MALLYRHSPTYLGSSSRRSTRSSTSEPSLRPCVSCSLTCLVPTSRPPGPPVNPPPYGPSPPPSPVSAASSEYEWRSHDHPTIFVRCAGHVASPPTKTLRRGGLVEAGVGVSFATPSRYDLAEAIPSTMAAGDSGVKRMTVTPNRVEVFAAVRALDRVKGILGSCMRDRTENGWWQAVLGGMHLGLGGCKRLPPGATLPGKVEEVVVLTNSDYVISAITAPALQKPWRATPEGQRRFAPVSSRRNASISSSPSSSRCSSPIDNGAPRRAWLTRKSSKARKSDFDLLFELDLLVEELMEKYGVRVCFHKALVGEAMRLAQRGARKEEVEN